MHHHRNSDGPSALPTPAPRVDRVCGIGLCDVLRVELEACQVPSLRAHLTSIGQGLAAALDRGDAEDLDGIAYAHRVVAMIASQLDDAAEQVVVCGPAPLLSDVIATVTRETAVELAERLEAAERDGPALQAAGRVAAAWVETYVATKAVEHYSFDPARDPLRP